MCYHRKVRYTLGANLVAPFVKVVSRVVLDVFGVCDAYEFDIGVHVHTYTFSVNK